MSPAGHQQSHLAILTECAAQIGGQVHGSARAVVAPAVRRLARDGGETVPIAANPRRLAMKARRAVRSAIQPQAQICIRRSSRWRDQIDRPAQQRTAEPKSVAALIDLGVAGDQRIYQLEIAEAVGLVERHAVLGQQHASVMAGVADPRSADRQADVAAPLLLRIDARRVAQDVRQIGRIAIGVGFGRDDGDRAGRAAETRPRLGDDGRIIGAAAGGDDDAVDLGRGGGLRQRRTGHGRRQQRARRCRGSEKH